jgi:serine/threonine protein phosphatase PrpC
MNQPSVNLEQTLPSTTDCEGITVVGRTHQGMVRLNNEDTFGAFTDIGLFAVCDGMGGHAAGEVASDLALRSFFHSVFESRHSLGPDADPSLRHQRNAVVSAIHRAHQAVQLRAKENPDLAGGREAAFVSSRGTTASPTPSWIRDASAPNRPRNVRMCW